MELRTGPSRERGQTLVAVALMLVALIGLAALALDVGNLYAQRRFVQNAADAAALAGARRLAVDEAWAVEGDVDEYAQKNGAEVVGMTVISDSVGEHVAVTVTKVVPTYFMGVMGIETSTVAAAAQAGYCPLNKPAAVMPMAVISDNCVLDVKSVIWGSTVDLPYDIPADDYNPLTDNLIVPPNTGWINLDQGEKVDQSASNLMDDVDADGYNGVVSVGDYYGAVGIMDKLAKIIDEWTTAAGIEAEQELPDELRVNEDLDVIVPVYTQIQDTDNEATKLFTVSGFAVFHIYDVVKYQGYKYIVGQFRHMAEIQPQARCGGVDYGARIVQLER